jgi:hypothetical protein
MCVRGFNSTLLTRDSLKFMQCTCDMYAAQAHMQKAQPMLPTLSRHKQLHATWYLCIIPLVESESHAHTPRANTPPKQVKW